MISQVYPDIPRFYTAIAEWAACMVYIVSAVQQDRLRIDGNSSGRDGWRRTAWICIMMLIFQCVFLAVTADLPTVLWLPCMLGAVLIMMAFIKTVCRVSLLGATYYSIQSEIIV